MCGIFGYSGNKHDATRAVFAGLKRLDYRGYDSWGIAVLSKSHIHIDKQVGVVSNHRLKLPKSSVAIGHTRWATNGAVTKINAHPHLASDKTFALAHNGIVENFATIKNQLIGKGYNFISETDTEVIVRLIEDKRKVTNNLVDAIRKAFAQLTGRNTIIVLSVTGEIIAAKNGSPLVIGINDNNKDIYFSSDTLSFAPHVHQVLVLENGQMVVSQLGIYKVLDISTGETGVYRLEPNDIKDSEVDKKGYEHFMLKEIHEAPDVIINIIKQDQKMLMQLATAIKNAATVYIIGSGTAGIAAAQIAYFLRTLAHIPAVSLIGAESKEYLDLFTPNDLIIAPSQSGETADVLEILEQAAERRVKIASYVNMPGSMMTRLSAFKFLASAGPEICVMSTKVFVSQIAWGYLLAKTVSGKMNEGARNLQKLVDSLKKILKDKVFYTSLKKLAMFLSKKSHIFLLAKGQNLQIIKEGMIKIVEGAYIHAHGTAAGDLKHYAITLMEPGVPVIFVFSNDKVKTDVLNALHEVKARGAEIIALAPQNQIEFDHFIKVADMGETSSIFNIVPLQLLAYEMSRVLHHNVDKPRNIAKSVTVK